jgi:hypothetical protein
MKLRLIYTASGTGNPRTPYVLADDSGVVIINFA